MNLLRTSNLVSASISVIALTSIGLPCDAQITVTMGGVQAVVPEKGRTEQLNVSQGQRTTLSVGNGVTLGTALNCCPLGQSHYPDHPAADASGTYKLNLAGTTPGLNINIENISANSDSGLIPDTK